MIKTLLRDPHVVGKVISEHLEAVLPQQCSGYHQRQTEEEHGVARGPFRQRRCKKRHCDRRKPNQPPAIVDKRPGPFVETGGGITQGLRARKNLPFARPRPQKYHPKRNRHRYWPKRQGQRPVDGGTQMFKHCWKRNACYAAHTARSISFQTKRPITHDPLLRSSIGAPRDEHAELPGPTWILQPNDAGPDVVFSFSAHFTYIRNGPAAASNAPSLLIGGAPGG